MQYVKSNVLGPIRFQI
uniref:Uncharacterized protein n=1 Tax=Anguilla anguilla TaxID=7936 RepID=A0A0E9UFJ1_ANGAN